MKPKYRLTKSNKIYLGVLLGITIPLFILRGNTSPESVGDIIAFLLFPCLFGWVVWRLSGKPENGGSITFNVVLTILVMGQFPKSERKSASEYSLKEGVELLEDTANSLKGDDKIAMNIALNLVNQGLDLGSRWEDSFDAVFSEDGFEVSHYADKNEMDRHIVILQNHINLSNEYFNNSLCMLESMEKEIQKAVGTKSEYANRFIAQARKQTNESATMMRKLLGSHVTYAGYGIEIIELLKKNSTKWKIKGGVIEFNDSELENHYYSLLESQKEAGENIDSLADELAKLLD